MDEALRLQPAMASRRLLVLTFIRQYIGRWGASPSISEIAEGTGSGRGGVKAALRALEADGSIVRRPGPRGIALPDRLADAVRQLREAGYIVDGDIVRGASRPVLDFDPD